MQKSLVAYFSATGTTAAAAKLLAEAACADIHEIRPEVPYSKSDLNWMNPFSRSTREIHGKHTRPAILRDTLDPADYDVIYLGFPIWGYVAPTIINTFLEAHDFSGKKIVLFATSEGSGFGKTAKCLAPSVADSAVIVEGGLLNGEVTSAALAAVIGGAQ